MARSAKYVIAKLAPLRTSENLTLHLRSYFRKQRVVGLDVNRSENVSIGNFPSTSTVNSCVDAAAGVVCVTLRKGRSDVTEITLIGPRRDLSRNVSAFQVPSVI